MKVYIAFLRGANMAGHNSIKMNDLSKMFADIGFRNAVTYIQSGNVIFATDDNVTESKLEKDIEAAINKKWGYNVATMIRAKEKVAEIISNNPFLDDKAFHPSKTSAVVFLREELTHDQIEKLRNINYPPDRFIIKSPEIYILCPHGFGRTKLYTNFFEGKLKVEGTARNMKTLAAILEIAEKF
jgi:uncharacterized protein (DUF1697 family)